MATPEQELTDALLTHPDRLLVISGAGVSCATVQNATNSCATWLGLLQHGIQWCIDHCPNRPGTWEKTVHALIATGRVADLIVAAGMIKRELLTVHQGEFGKWLHESIGTLQVHDDRTIKALGNWGVRLATTNFENFHEAVLKIRAVTWKEPALVRQVLLGDEQGVFHIHGHFRDSESVVLDAQSYEAVCTNVETQNYLRCAIALNTIVFVGCGDGLQDPNFGSLFEFISAALRQTHGRHFHLVRDAEVGELAARYSTQNLPIRATPYGPGHSDLPTFLAKLAKLAESQRRADPITSLRYSQADHELQLRELKAQRETLNPTDYLRQTYEINLRLWNAGGQRTAALNMQSAFEHCAQTLTPNELLLYGLEPAEKLLEVGYADSASQLFHFIDEGLHGQAVPAEFREKFNLLRSRCFSAAGKFDTAIQAIDQAREESAFADQSVYEAQLAELHFIRGELDEAMGEEGVGDCQ